MFKLNSILGKFKLFLFAIECGWCIVVFFLFIKIILIFMNNTYKKGFFFTLLNIFCECTKNNN